MYSSTLFREKPLGSVGCGLWGIWSNLEKDRQTGCIYATFLIRWSLLQGNALEQALKRIFRISHTFLSQSKTRVHIVSCADRYSVAFDDQPFAYADTRFCNM